MSKNDNDGEFNGITTEALVNELSQRMKLSTREANEFRHMAMSRCGYKMVPRYVRPDDDERDRDDRRDYGRDDGRDDDWS